MSQPTYDGLTKAWCGWMAEGKTFPHKEDLISWGWHWNPGRHVWILDPGSAENAHDLCVKVIARLPGITVKPLPEP
jgi:hypothetical protein